MSEAPAAPRAEAGEAPAAEAGAAEPNLTLVRWELRPYDGSPPIRGDLRLPTEREPTTAVVICHGFKGFRTWGFFPLLARQLARRGHAAVSLDFSHNGVGADGVDFSALPLFARNTHTRNVAEIRTLIDVLARGRLLRGAPKRIGLFGHSRGGGEAVLAAAADARVDALVTWAAIASVDRWSPEQIARWERWETVTITNARTGQEMPIEPTYWRDVRRHRAALDVSRAAGRVRVPWLIVHGDADETVAVEEGHALHRAAPGSELLLLAGAGHTFGATHPFRGATPDLSLALEATAGWFNRHLEPS